MLAVFKFQNIRDGSVIRKGKLVMNRRSITLVIVVVLCMIGFAYGQGWLTRSNLGFGTGGTRVDTTSTKQDKASVHAEKTVEKSMETSGTATQ